MLVAQSHVGITCYPVTKGVSHCRVICQCIVLLCIVLKDSNELNLAHVILGVNENEF